jgi:hypothetical protein
MFTIHAERSGLPDGIPTFKPKIPTLGKVLECLAMKDVGIFYAHLEYILDIWYILWPLCNLVVIWYIFYRFGTLNCVS